MSGTTVATARWDEVVLEVLGRDPVDADDDAQLVCEALEIQGIGPDAARRLLTFGYGLPAAS